MDPYAPPLSDDHSTNPTGQGWDTIASPFAVSWSLFRHYFGLLLLCYAVVWMPLNLITAYADFYLIDEDDFQSSFRLQRMLGFWLGIIAEAAIISTVLDAWNGKRPKLGSGYANAFRSYGRMITTRFCWNLMVILGLLLLVVPGIWFIVRTLYIDAIAVAEKVHGPTAIRRSFELTRGRFGESFVVALLALAILLLTLMAFVIVYLPIVIMYEGESWLWVYEAVASLLFGLPMAYMHTLFACWYKKLASDELPTATSNDPWTLTPLPNSTVF